MKITDEMVARARDAHQRAYPGGIVGARLIQMRAALEAVAGDIRIATAEEIISEIERCALVLATENDETGNYLVAAVLKKAADIVRTTVGISHAEEE